MIISVLGVTDVASQFELVTSEKFSGKIPLFVLFSIGVAGNYFSLYKLWRQPSSITVNRFVLLYGITLIIATVLILIWLSDVINGLKEVLGKVEYPTDVDEVTFRVRSSLLNSVFWMFFVLGVMGAVSLSVVLFNLRSLSRGEN